MVKVASLIHEEFILLWTRFRHLLAGAVLASVEIASAALRLEQGPCNQEMKPYRVFDEAANGVRVLSENLSEPLFKGVGHVIDDVCAA
jgi:hypothetical protein